MASRQTGLRDWKLVLVANEKHRNVVLLDSKNPKSNLDRSYALILPRSKDLLFYLKFSLKKKKYFLPGKI
ncbi:hypothetical protein [Myxosarcina sp. GI1]|uniref:hypothetical protein n=1 Tax=Myxosarcina sp. GI1 TaxID=1541065 RepID=UPI0012E02CEF|nr:hypothetical protein [Myxosarcina sp. GI1]